LAGFFLSHKPRKTIYLSPYTDDVGNAFDEFEDARKIYWSFYDEKI
jgi:hypothetical protein